MKRFFCITFGALIVCLLPTSVPAQVKPDLQIENLSVYSTMAEPNGFHRISVSFRIKNSGSASAQPSTTRVLFDNQPADFAISTLRPGDSAYVSRGLSTQAAQVVILVVADAQRAVFESDETNNQQQYIARLRLDPGRWMSIGPSKIQDDKKTVGVGKVTTIAVDPRTPAIVYAGAAGSGLWKTVNSGTTWFPIADSLPTAKIDAISVDPNNSSRVLVATPAGVFESLDEGSVWTQLARGDLQGMGAGGGHLLIAKRTNPPLYLSSLKGLLVSTDGGRTWEPVLRPDARIVSLQFSTRNPSHLFASVGGSATRHAAVYEARDGGTSSASWHQLRGCGPDTFPSFHHDALVWIAESQDQMWLSFKIGSAENNRFGLWHSTPKTCTSADGFVEHVWEPVNLQDTCGKFENQWSYLFAHPDDPNIVFKGGIELCRSKLGGKDLTPVADIHADHQTVAISPSAPFVMYFGTDGGIYRSTNMGVTMQFVGEGLANTELYKIDTFGDSPRVVVGGSQDNGSSTWDGLSPVWNYVDSTGDSEVVAFDRKDPRRIYEIGQSTQQIEILKPGGDKQKLAEDSATLPDCKGPAVSIVSTGIEPALGITCQGIWKGPEFVQTPFGPIGPSWHRIQPVPIAGDFVQLRASPSRLEWVGATRGGEVYFGPQLKTLNKVFTMPSPGTATAITFVNSQSFYVAANMSSQGFVYRFQCDPNCTAEDIWHNNLAGAITAISVDPLAPDTLLAAVAEKGIFRGIRDTSGKWTWSAYNNGLPFGVTVTDMKTHSGGSVVAATFGRGAFQLTSRIVGSQKLTAKGHVIEFDLNAGSLHTTTAAVIIDSLPDLLFTDAKPLQAILQNAFKTHRVVIIEYVPAGNNSKKIVSVKFAQ